MVKISLNLNDLLAEQKQLSDFLSSPNAFSDPQFSAKNKRFTELETLVAMAKKRVICSNAAPIVADVLAARPSRLMADGE